MADAQKHILVVDDDAAMRSLLSDFLSHEARVTEFPLATQALEYLRRAGPDDVDLIISDINMPEMTGTDFAAQSRELRPKVPIILITAFGSIESAIVAIRKGAFDYIVKPFKLTEIGVTVERALRFRELETENRRLKRAIQHSNSFSDIVGKSPGMQQVFDLVSRVSQATANVLIMGESGTGKERVARAIHNLGPRAKKAFVAINCTAIPETLLESELFGHAKGSFTGAIGRKRGLFEEAEGGTIFLDEIGDMDASMQAKLLRVIQERKIRAVGDTVDKTIDVRVIAATHKDLKAAIKDGRFREDLYYRLSVIPIVIPPLRHRPEDIPLLAEYFLEKYAAANGSKVTGFSPDAMRHLVQMSWEGNVRELENVIERAVVLCRTEKIEPADLPRAETSDADTILAQATAQMPTLDELERRYMKFVLEKTGGRKEKAAQILGVNRRTLYRKEREYGFVDASPHDEEDEDLHDEV
ncbi:MAG: sigma-54 dependent transcriptional regulator [Bdellovibrionaceae bacterium]|nr:sigma-54 dependent transcriptional regulator [Pseudobdellovibrionaceae bacterium]